MEGRKPLVIVGGAVLLVLLGVAIPVTLSGSRPPIIGPELELDPSASSELWDEAHPLLELEIKWGQTRGDLTFAVPDRPEFDGEGITDLIYTVVATVDRDVPDGGTWRMDHGAGAFQPGQRIRSEPHFFQGPGAPVYRALIHQVSLSDGRTLLFGPPDLYTSLIQRMITSRPKS